MLLCVTARPMLNWFESRHQMCEGTEGCVPGEAGSPRVLQSTVSAGRPARAAGPADTPWGDSDASQRPLLGENEMRSEMELGEHPVFPSGGEWEVSKKFMEMRIPNMHYARISKMFAPADTYLFMPFFPHEIVEVPSCLHRDRHLCPSKIVWDFRLFDHLQIWKI